MPKNKPAEKTLKKLRIVLFVTKALEKYGSMAKKKTSSAKAMAITIFIIFLILQSIVQFPMRKTQLMRALCSTAKSLQMESKPFFKPFQEGVKLEMNNSLIEANQMFFQCLKEIKTSGQQQLDHYWHIHKRIAHNYRRLGKNKDAEKVLYDIITKKRQSLSNETLVYEDYDNLFKHLITYDLEKGIKLAKALVQQKSLKTPLSYIKLFNFNLGNAYLLAGNYSDAKKRLRNCLQSDPQGSIKSYAYNNLGLSCWWHKNPIENPQNIQNTPQIDKDFHDSLSLFFKSIKIAETQSNPEKNNLQLSLSMQDAQYDFQSSDSLPSLSNVVQFLLANDPLKKNEILFWLKKMLSTSRLHQNSNYLDRAILQQAFLTNNLEIVRQKMSEVVLKYRYQQKFVQESFYARAVGLAFRGTDEKKSNEYLQRAKLIDSVLPSWSHKLKFMAFSELNLLK